MEASRRVLFAGAIGIVLCIILSSSSSFTLAELQFGYYKLAMQWPISYCNIGIRCKGTVGDDFKIHGLWPFWANDTIVKSPCPGEEMPPISVVRGWNIKRSLDGYWPSVSGSNYSFWQYEWNTHGRCSGLKPYEYFSLALTLAQNHHDILEKLLLAGFEPTPGKKHLIQKLHTLITHIPSSSNTSVEINCNIIPRRGSQLSEIHFCYGRDKIIRACRYPTDGCGRKNAMQSTIFFADKSTLSP